MASWTYIGDSTTQVNLTKNSLEYLKTVQKNNAEFMVDKVTRAKFMEALSTISSFVTSIFKLGNAGDVADGVVGVSTSLTELKREELYSAVTKAWQDMYNFQENWNKRKVLPFTNHNDVIKVRLQYPTRLYKNNANGKVNSFITGPATMIGFTVESGLEFTM